MDSSQFESVKTKTASLPDRVADQIAQLIIDQHLTSEDKLPNEFELASQLNVGRGTVREAVKLLVARNVLVIRRGKGTYIANNPGEMDDPLGFAFIPDQIQLAFDLMEVRLQVEPWVARLAAQRRTPDELERVQAYRVLVEQEIKAGRDHLPLDMEFHLSIAKCTHNQAVPKLMPLILHSVSLFGCLTRRSLRSYAVNEHRLIAEAIAAGDGARSEAVMREHIEHNQQKLEAIRRQMEVSQEEKPK